MVMFREDEERMIAAERAAEPRWKKRLRLLVKVVFFASCLFFFSLFVISRLGGNGDALKKGLEQYLIQATAMVPEVGTLNGITFFPVMSVNADDVALYKPLPGAKPVKDMPLPHGRLSAFAGHMSIDIAFWDMFFSRRLIRGVDIKNIRFEAGSIDADPVSFSFIRLDPKGYKDGPAIVAEGKHGETKVNAVFQLEKKGRSYGVPDSAAFEADIGKIRFTGNLKRVSEGALWTFTSFGTENITGDVTFKKTAAQLNMKANLHAKDSDLSLDMVHPQQKPWKGTLKASRLDMADVAPLLTLAAQLSLIWPDAKALKEFVLTADISQLKSDGQNVGAFGFRLHKNGSILSACDFAGTVEISGVGKDNEGIIAIRRNGMNLVIPARPECMQGTLSAKDGDMILDRLVMASRAARFEGTGKIGTKTVYTNLKPVAGSGCTP